MCEENVVCNSGLLYGLPITACGLFLFFFLIINRYPPEVYEGLFHTHILPNIYYFYLAAVAVCLILLGIGIAWISDR